MTQTVCGSISKKESVAINGDKKQRRGGTKKRNLGAIFEEFQCNMSHDGRVRQSISRKTSKHR